MPITWKFFTVNFYCNIFIIIGAECFENEFHLASFPRSRENGSAKKSYFRILGGRQKYFFLYQLNDVIACLHTGHSRGFISFT